MSYPADWKIKMDATQMLEFFIGQITETIEQANVHAKRVKSATEGIDSQIADYIAESDDTEVAQYREWVAKAEQQLAAIREQMSNNKAAIEAKAREAIGGDLDIDIEAEKAEYLKLRKERNNKVNGLKQFLSTEDVDAALAEIPELIGFRGTTSTGGGTGSPRPRLESLFINGEPLSKATFTEAVAVLNKDFNAKIEKTGDLVNSALEAAGTKDWTSLSGPQEFTYGKATIVWTPRTSA